jgi:hypothetical protein
MTRDSYDVLGIFAFLLVALIVVAVIYFQFQGWIQCTEDGGQYLRSWVGWPTCVMP